jgi:hypothetical protein
MAMLQTLAALQNRALAIFTDRASESNRKNMQ